jgi:hypothetical protein
MIAGIMLVDTTPLPGLTAFFKFLPFRMQLVQNMPPTTNRKCNLYLSRFMVPFLYFFFSDLDQCFRPHCSCFSTSL